MDGVLTIFGINFPGLISASWQCKTIIIYLHLSSSHYCKAGFSCVSPHVEEEFGLQLQGSERLQVRQSGLCQPCTVTVSTINSPACTYP